MLQRLIYVYFIYLILEGALRKWFLPGFSKELFLIKDLLLAFGAFMLVAQTTVNRNLRFLHIFNRRDLIVWGGWIFFFTGHLFVTSFSLPGLIGLRYYLIMLPILVLLPLAIRDLDHLNALFLKYYSLAIPVGILGVVQFMSPSSSRINTYAWSSAEMAVATLGESATRITGTFSYISPYAVYLQYMLLLGLCLYLNLRSARERLVIALSMALILGNIAMTGSRAPFLMAVIVSVPLVLKIFKRKDIKRFSTVVSLLLMACLLFVFANPFAMLADRHKHSGDTESRIFGALYTPFYTLQSTTLIGKGVGATFGGMAEATGSAAEDSGFEEVIMDRVGIEVGIIGYLLVLLVKIFYLLGTFRFYRWCPYEDIRVWVLAAFLLQCSSLWNIPIYNSTAAAFYFASLAIFFKMREFTKERLLETGGRQDAV